MSDPTLDEQVEALFPLDGPYNDERTRAAARSIAALVRYLNHAGWSANAYPWPATVDSVVGSLNAAVVNLDQHLQQVEQWFGELCARGDAYTTGPDTLAIERDSAALSLRYARQHLANAQGALSSARQHTSRVGLDEARAQRERAEQ